MKILALLLALAILLVCAGESHATDDVFDVPDSSSELDINAGWVVASHDLPSGAEVARHVRTVLSRCCSFSKALTDQRPSASGNISGQAM
jgi:hypothetical protein